MSNANACHSEYLDALLVNAKHFTECIDVDAQST